MLNAEQGRKNLKKVPAEKTFSSCLSRLLQHSALIIQHFDNEELSCFI
jgi:hypothetical protein